MGLYYQESIPHLHGWAVIPRLVECLGPRCFLKLERMMWRQGSCRWKLWDNLLGNNIATLEQQQQIIVTDLRKYLTNQMTYLGARCQNSQSSHWHCTKWTNRNLSGPPSLLPPPSAGPIEGNFIYVHKNLMDKFVHDVSFSSNFLRWKMKWYFNLQHQTPHIKSYGMRMYEIWLSVF